MAVGIVGALGLVAGCGSDRSPIAAVPDTSSAGPVVASPTPARPTPAPAPPVRTPGYTFPVAHCRTDYGHSHHDYPATDIFAARGCGFVSPVAGTVSEVARIDLWNPATNLGAARGGLSVSVVGADGVRYYGSHLSSITTGIRPGVVVRRGQPLGRVGNTGSARGIATHLHFGLSWPTRGGIWWVRRGMLYPWPYLDSWHAGRQRSPVAAIAALHRRLGDVPRCAAGC